MVLSILLYQLVMVVEDLGSVQEQWSIMLAWDRSHQGEKILACVKPWNSQETLKKSLARFVPHPSFYISADSASQRGTASDPFAA